MEGRVDANASHRYSAERRFPANGPIAAGFGYGLFYLLVERATPTVVEVFSETVLDFSPSLVRFGLATALWFVLVVTVIDQGRRQLEALGILTRDAERSAAWLPDVSAPVRTGLYFVGVLAGGLLAVWSFERGIETAVALIVVVATLDVGAFPIRDFLVMAVFFVAFSVATHSLDRLVLGGVRTLLSGQ